MTHVEKRASIRPNVHRILRLALVMACLGCSPPSDALQRVVVTGEVTFKGQPVERGDIQFVPIQGTAGPSTGALIEDGKYTADHRGGVPVGSHRVVILAHRRKAGSKPFTDDGPGMVKGEYPQEQYLPAKYNRRTELFVEITPDDPQVDFPLE